MISDKNLFFLLKIHSPEFPFLFEIGREVFPSWLE